MIDIYDKEAFIDYYYKCKYEGKLDAEIVKELCITTAWFTVVKRFHGVETITIRKNKVDVTEEDFRKGALNGLDRRIILRRVRDGMHVKLAINTPRKGNGRKKK